MRPVLIPGLALFALVGCHPDVRALTPLVGRWTASDPRFENCMMSFTPDGWVILEGSSRKREACRIQRIEVDQEVDREPRSFRIEYEDTEGEDSSLSLVLDDEGDLRLQNRQEVTWKRSKAKR